MTPQPGMCIPNCMKYNINITEGTVMFRVVLIQTYDYDLKTSD